VAEVGATLDFFLSSATESEKLAKVLLAGAGSSLGGLAELFSAQLHVPVERLSPLTGIRVPRRLVLDEVSTAQLSVSAGLCMGATAS